jgi:hypothetical protein
MISTPRGETGQFYEMFCKARDGMIDHATVIHAPAWELNPALDSEECPCSKTSGVGTAMYAVDSVVGSALHTSADRAPRFSREAKVLGASNLEARPTLRLLGCCTPPARATPLSLARR